jgi:DNA repair photolyase
MSAKIYEPKGKAREYSPLALNYYSGCNHGCKYCYVKPMMRRFNSNYEHDKVSVSDIESKKSDISKNCKKHQNSKDPVFLNFTSDPYNVYDLELGEKSITRHALKSFIEKKIPAIILTKSHNVTRDIDLFKKFNGNIVAGFSLTFFDSEISKKWEPEASKPKQRLRALKTLKDNNIKTWASFEPVISTKQSLKLLETVAKYKLVDYVKVGKLNNYKGLDKKIDWDSFLASAVEILRKSNIDFYIKKDLAKFNKSTYLAKTETSMDYLNVKNTYKDADMRIKF